MCIWPLGSAYWPYFPNKINLVVYLLGSFINLNESFILIGFNSSVDIAERGGNTIFSKCLWLETMKNQLLGLFLLAFLLLADWFVVRSSFLSGGGGTRVNRKWSKETSCLLNISKWVLLLCFFKLGQTLIFLPLSINLTESPVFVFWVLKTNLNYKSFQILNVILYNYIILENGLQVN